MKYVALLVALSTAAMAQAPTPLQRAQRAAFTREVTAAHIADRKKFLEELLVVDNAQDIGGLLRAIDAPSKQVLFLAEEHGVGAGEDYDLFLEKVHAVFPFDCLTFELPVELYADYWQRVRDVTDAEAWQDPGTHRDHLRAALARAKAARREESSPPPRMPALAGEEEEEETDKPSNTEKPSYNDDFVFTLGYLELFQRTHASEVRPLMPIDRLTARSAFVNDTDRRNGIMATALAQALSAGTCRKIVHVGGKYHFLTSYEHDEEGRERLVVPLQYHLPTVASAVVFFWGWEKSEVSTDQILGQSNLIALRGKFRGKGFALRSPEILFNFKDGSSFFPLDAVYIPAVY